MGVGGFGSGVLLLFVLAPCCALLHRDYLRRWEAAAETPVLTCERLRGEPLPRVAVVARTTAQEIITAPVSGADCVCYWTESRSGTYDESENRDTWLTESRHQVGRVEIEDGTGTAVVTPRLAEHALTGRRDRVIQTARHRSMVKQDRAGTYDVQETRVWSVPPGIAVVVIGSVEWDGDVPVLDLADQAGGSGTTSRSRPEAIAYLAARSARWGTATRVSAVTGLTAASAGLGLVLLHLG